MPLSFHYQLTSFKLKNTGKLKEWILSIAFIEKRVIGVVDFIFCTDDFLLALNKKFLSHKSLTDILTFDSSQDGELSAEIYISIQRVKENAAKFNTSFPEELHRVMIHGILHCIGYRDKKKQDQKKMRKKEDEYLALLSQM